MGDKMKYSDETTKRICELLSKGASRVAAAEGAGITYSIFYEWIHGNIPEKALAECKTDEEINNKKNEFFEAIKKAEDEFHNRLKAKALAKINDAMDAGTWTAAAWYLERKHKDEYSQRYIQAGDKDNPMQHKHEVTKKIDFSGLTTNELRRLANLGNTD